MRNKLCEYCEINGIECYSKLYMALQLKVLSSPLKKDKQSIENYWNKSVKPHLINIPFPLIKSLIKLKWYQIERHKK